MNKLIVIFFVFSYWSFVAILPRTRPCSSRPVSWEADQDDSDDDVIDKKIITREVIDGDGDVYAANDETRSTMATATRAEREKIVIEKLKSVETTLSCEEVDVLAGMAHRTLRRGDGEEWSVLTSPENDVIKLHYRESTSPSDFRKLRAEIAKRKRHERHLAGVAVPVRAACVDETRRKARILRDIEPATTKLCDDPPPRKLTAATASRGGQFTDEPCFRLAKFRSLIAAAKVRTSMVARNVANFVRSFACFVAALEEGNLFLENFHGGNFVVDVNDFTVKLADTESLIFHGDGEAPNLYGGTSCFEDQHCGSPIGRYWGRGSANLFFYQTCFSRNFCVDNRCVGFNASLHLCALRRWVIPPVATALMKIDPNIGASFNQIISTLDPILSDPTKRGGRGTSRQLCRQLSDLHRQVLSGL